jgi:hypothetical protein
MCSPSGLTEFAQKCIQNITRDGLAEPVLLIVDQSVEKPSSAKEKLRKSVRLNGNLWYLQEKLFPLSKIPAYQTRPLNECLPGLERIDCETELKGKWSQYFKAEDIETIRSYKLDFILKFAFGIIRGAVLETARYGVWSFHHDDEEKYRGGPPAFWEIYQSDLVTGALLQKLNDRLDGGVVLHKCYVPTDIRSYRANLQRIQECSWHMVRWACLDVVQGRIAQFQAPPSQTKAPIYRAPNDWQTLKFWFRLAGNFVKYKFNNQRIDDWNIGIIDQPAAAFLNPEFKPNVRWWDYNHRSRMIADPFPLNDEDPSRILIEEFDWGTERGRISEISANGVKPVIDEGSHLSYPFVFRDKGATYCVPESGDAKGIFLYRLNESIGAFSRLATLADGLSAVDSTLFEHNGKWWMLYSQTTGCGPWSLYVMHAPNLLGPWEPHVANPVKTDVKCSRPAGPVFVHEGALYRPSQDNRKCYGGALCITRIDELTEDRFRETPVRWIAPDALGAYPDGMHTLSGRGTFTVVDGKKHKWPLGLVMWRLFSKKLGVKPKGFTDSI